MAITRFAHTLRRTTLQAGFFTSHQPTASLASRASNSDLGSRPISFSASSGAPADSSSRSSRGSRTKAEGPQSGARSGSPSPSRKLNQSAHHRTNNLNTTSKQVTPCSSALLPHAGPALVSYDGFFSLHRPLLELPVRFRSRKATKSLSPANIAPTALSLESAPLDEVAQAFETLEMGEDGQGEEFVQVVDLDEAGNPTGSTYIASVGGAGDESLRDLDATAESLLAEDAQLEAEHAHAQLEADAAHGEELRFESPYDAHLIGEPEGQLHPPNVARYLAENQPFTTPAAPVASTSSLATATRAPAPVDPPTQANLSFLRPFSAPKQSVSPILTSIPMSASECAMQADKFLTGAHVHHLISAHTDAIDFVHEPLAIAANYYAAPVPTEADVSAPVYQPRFETPRQQGEVRVWSEKTGWSVVDFSQVGANSGSPFLPAEMVDLDWEDELAVGMMNLGELGAAVERVEMDSVKRKRKKKITKHKYKKRRKAQRALRQRLGK